MSKLTDLVKTLESKVVAGSEKTVPLVLADLKLEVARVEGKFLGSKTGTIVVGAVGFVLGLVVSHLF